MYTVQLGEDQGEITGFPGKEFINCVDNLLLAKDYLQLFTKRIIHQEKHNSEIAFWDLINIFIALTILAVITLV